MDVLERRRRQFPQIALASVAAGVTAIGMGAFQILWLGPLWLGIFSLFVGIQSFCLIPYWWIRYVRRR